MNFLKIEEEIFMIPKKSKKEASLKTSFFDFYVNICHTDRQILVIRTSLLPCVHLGLFCHFLLNHLSNAEFGAHTEQCHLHELP